MSRRATPALLALLALAAGCTRGSTSERPPIHLNPNMDDQPRYEAQESSEFFADGKAMRHPVAGTVARGDLVDRPELATGFGPDGAPLETAPVEVTPELLSRGAERYAIYCAPCHADSGDGQSMLRRRSGVATADLLQERLRGVSDGYLYRVIVEGFGLMPGYAYQLGPRDRWAVVAHVRALQRGVADGEGAPGPGQGADGAGAPNPAEATP